MLSNRRTNKIDTDLINKKGRITSDLIEVDDNIIVDTSQEVVEEIIEEEIIEEIEDDFEDEIIEEDIEEEIIEDDQDEEAIEDTEEIIKEKIVKETIVKKEVKEKPKKEKKQIDYYKANKVINIIFAILLIIILLVSIDIILVGKFELGPFLAIPVKKHNDGGTKEYYGLGYKVINYNQKVGRRDKVVGYYSLKYDTTPIDVDAIDLAIEFTNNETKAYKKYYKKFIRVNGNLKETDNKNNTIIVNYEYEDNKYAIEINCEMATNKKELNNFDINSNISFIGTVYDYDVRTNDNPTILYVKNCFAQQ